MIGREGGAKKREAGGRKGGGETHISEVGAPRAGSPKSQGGNHQSQLGWGWQRAGMLPPCQISCHGLPGLPGDEH